MLTDKQLEEYERNGFLLLPDIFSSDEVDSLAAELPRLYSEDRPGRILEKDGQSVRTVFGAHNNSAIFRRLSEDARIARPAIQLLNSEVYIHQLKINVKAAFRGDIWQWHQDYIYWLLEDGMSRPEALTASVWLDDVNEFNGPLLLIPGSHRMGMIDVAARRTAPDWMSTVIADLKYSLGPEEITDLITRNGIVAPKGHRGSVLIFHCNIVHGSVPNMSPFDRRIIFITLNSMENQLLKVAVPRPDFLADRQYRRIVPVEVEQLIGA